MSSSANPEFRDEAEALPEKAYQEHRAESEIVREALRGFMRIEGKLVYSS